MTRCRRMWSNSRGRYATASHVPARCIRDCIMSSSGCVAIVIASNAVVAVHTSGRTSRSSKHFASSELPRPLVPGAQIASSHPGSSNDSISRKLSQHLEHGRRRPPEPDRPLKTNSRYPKFVELVVTPAPLSTLSPKVVAQRSAPTIVNRPARFMRPLIIFLHGSGDTGAGAKMYVRSLLEEKEMNEFDWDFPTAEKIPYNLNGEC